ncbi:MAG TPA: DNA polymerase Y family protein [Gammaproteobacteria bacterium]
MAPFAKPIALPPFGEARASSVDAHPPLRKVQLWIAVHLPDLALRAAQAASADARPTIVVEALRGRLRVVALNEAARSRGIGPGLDLSAAFGFSGALRVLERSPQAERVLLEALAAACCRFTPAVSLEPPQALLLEVLASLRLFRGLERLKRTLASEIARRGLDFRLSAAVTPLGALWLARCGGGDAVSSQELVARLGPLPLHVTGWPETVLELLESFGIGTVGECLRLPRGGFARRVGKRYLEDLDKALGRHPDLRTGFEAPRSLSFKIELIDESTSLSVLVDAVTRMTARLADELRIRQARVGKMRLRFEHRRHPASIHDLDLLEATADRSRLLDLLCDRLERIALPAPATAVVLEAGPLEPVRPSTGPLLGRPGGAHGAETHVSRMQLVERLRARFGADAVHGIAPAADHRPERAWIAVVPGAPCGSASPPVPHRPLWLAPAPERLACVEGEPCFRGAALRLLDGPERIESGWWDGGIARDYFAAAARSGERLWIYRDRTAGHWYLHGVFG